MNLLRVALLLALLALAPVAAMAGRGGEVLPSPQKLWCAYLAEILVLKDHYNDETGYGYNDSLQPGDVITTRAEVTASHGDPMAGPATPAAAVKLPYGTRIAISARIGGEARLFYRASVQGIRGALYIDAEQFRHLELLDNMMAAEQRRYQVFSRKAAVFEAKMLAPYNLSSEALSNEAQKQRWSCMGTR